MFVLSIFLFAVSCTIVPRSSSINYKTGHSLFFDKAEVSITPNSNWESNQIVAPKPEHIAPEVNSSVEVLNSIEYIPPSFFRYAVLLDVDVEQLTNQKLIAYIDEWWGVPYKYGGGSMKGIDCSNFIKGLTQYTYGVTLPRTSKDQAVFCKTIEKTALKEGDLVFFNTGVGISHVGLYLANNKFVHASTSLGVVISSLNEAYWKKRFVKAGRIEKAG